MARENAVELILAERALANALRGRAKIDDAGYCERAEDNLVASVAAGIWRHVKEDLASGKGSELAGKFRAAYSSSALAVNTFAPLLDYVPLPESELFEGSLRFEQERSAWAPGYWPTLDVIVEDQDAPVRLYIESKCTEFLRRTHTDFSHAFVNHAEKHLSTRAWNTFRDLFDDPFAFDPVDARQLAKHFLAARRAIEDATTSCKIVLACIAWEPTDADKYEVFGRHAAKLGELANALPDDSVTLVSLTYRQLWDHWEAIDDALLRRHTRLLRDRYDVSLRP